MTDHQFEILASKLNLIIVQLEKLAENTRPPTAEERARHSHSLDRPIAAGQPRPFPPIRMRVLDQDGGMWMAHWEERRQCYVVMDYVGDGNHPAV